MSVSRNDEVLCNGFVVCVMRLGKNRWIKAASLVAGAATTSAITAPSTSPLLFASTN